VATLFGRFFNVSINFINDGEYPYDTYSFSGFGKVTPVTAMSFILTSFRSRKMLRFRSLTPLPEKFHENLDLMEVCLKLVTSTPSWSLVPDEVLCVLANIFVFLVKFGNVSEKCPKGLNQTHDFAQKETLSHMGPPSDGWFKQAKAVYTQVGKAGLTIIVALHACISSR
jgi:hypothetical protein